MKTQLKPNCRTPQHSRRNPLKSTIALLLALSLGGALTNVRAVEDDTLPGLGVQPVEYFYTGKPYDADSESYTFRYRNYDPELNRWTSVDPCGFPDGANVFSYCRNIPTAATDHDGLYTALWIGEENTYSPNQTYQQLPATTFTWNVTHNGVSQLSGSYTGTFQEIYDLSATVGFVTWRGLHTTDFGVSQSLSLVSRNSSGDWEANGWTVSAGFLENAGASSGDIANVNTRLNPIDAGTSLSELRGFSTLLYGYLLGQGAGYSGDLFYE